MRITPHHMCADVSNLEQSSTILFECLNNIYMKVNTGKSYGYDWQ